jgi:uncharacterized protein with HEPN domain
MISNEAAALVWDAQRAAERIARFSEGKTYTDYLSDDMLRSAIERQFEIIGEAFTVLRRIAPEVAAQLRDLPKAVAFRNVLIHGYADIKHMTVWDTVQEDLPRLRMMLEDLLRSAPPLDDPSSPNA